MEEVIIDTHLFSCLGLEMPLHHVLYGGGDHGQHQSADQDVEDSGHVAQRQGTLAAGGVLLNQHSQATTDSNVHSTQSGNHQQ